MEFAKLRTFAKEGNEVWVSCVEKRDDAITEPTSSESSGLVRNCSYEVTIMNSGQRHKNIRGRCPLLFEN